MTRYEEISLKEHEQTGVKTKYLTFRYIPLHMKTCAFLAEISFADRYSQPTITLSFPTRNENSPYSSHKFL